MERIVPKEKIDGQRLGQLIINAMMFEQEISSKDVHSVLFYVENDELEKTIQTYLDSGGDDE